MPAGTTPQVSTGVQAAASDNVTHVTRIHDQCISWASETEALRLAKSGHADLACQLLLRAIDQKPESLRLYDLLAVISLQKKLPRYQAEVVQAAQRFASIMKPRPVVLPRQEWYAGLWHRVITGVGTREPRKHVKKARKKCDGRTRNRVATKPKPGIADLLSARIQAWQASNSGWRQKWTASGKEWKVPESAKSCTQRAPKAR